MVIIIELLAFILFLLLSRKGLKKIFFFTQSSIINGILIGCFYALIILITKKTPFGSGVINQFIGGIKNVPFFILYIVYPLVIAFAEEFIFRYFMSKKIGVLLAALLFTALHWRPNFPTPLFLPVFILALTQSWLFKKTNTLIPLIIVHLFVTYSLLLL